jgi:hypothetical protein
VTELTLFDDLPGGLRNDPVADSIVHDLPNRLQGHLRIDGERGTVCFINLGSVVNLGPICGPTVDLTGEQLRVVGDYCLRMADRVEGAS